MPNYFSKKIYRMGGATFDVIKHCSPDIQTVYSNLGFSLIFCTLWASIAGFEICRQFTTQLVPCFCVGTLWAAAVFTFDYFLINSKNLKGVFKWVRIPVGLANVMISVTSIFVLLNQSTIDSNLRLLGSNEITKCDTTYQNEKQERYASLNAKKAEQEQYHKERCLPEARNGYPGKEYMKKHSLCITADSLLAKEQTQLDSAEVAYHTTYTTTRDAITGTTTNDFFRKAKELIPIFKDNYFTLFLAICALIFLSYIELQAILLKYNIDPNDEYHTNLRTYNANRKGLLASQMENEVSTEKDKILLSKKITDEEMTQKKFDADMNAADAKALRELEVKGKIEILRKKGYDATADDLEEVWKQYITSGSKSQGDAPDIFKMSQSMAHQVEEIQKVSTSENLTENVFNWVLTNITYDTGHSKEHYRTAREAYNEKRGLCGELSVLYMSFLRAVNIDCSFCEVTKDNTGKEVAHACIIIKSSDGKAHLSDVAYKAFTIDHAEYRELTDTELKSRYENWNQ